MQALVRMAAWAGGKMLLVVAAHFGRQAGNVIAPASQNLPYYGINALAHRPLQADTFHGRILRRQHDPVAQQRLLRPQGFFRSLAGNSRMVVFRRQVRQHYV